MARVRPFHALRYLNRRAERLIDAPMEARERRILGMRDIASPVHLFDAPNPAALLRSWIDQGELARAEVPALHVLEIEGAPLERHRQPPARMLLGLLGPDEELAPLEEGAAARSRPEVTPLEALAPDDHHVLRGLLEESIAGLFPMHETKLPERTYRLFRLDQRPSVKRMLAVLAETPVRPLRPLATGAPTLAAIYPMTDPGLWLRPVHRAIQNVPTFDPQRFLTLVREYARIVELEAPLDSAAGLALARERLAALAAGHHAVLFVLPDGQGRILRFRQGLELSRVRAAPKNPTLRSLDLALLNALVLRTVIGIEQPDEPGHPNVFAVNELDELVEGVQAGVFQAGFALNPPPLWEVRAVIAAAQQLPPRTLALEPAPPSGIVFFDPEQP
jgi:hypothetical protein